MGKKSRKAKGGGGLGRVNTAAGRALQGLVQSGQIKDGAHINITDANRGHLTALLGDAKNVRVAGDVQSLRAAVGDPNVELHGGGVVGGRVARPPVGVPPPPQYYAAPAMLGGPLPAPGRPVVQGEWVLPQAPPERAPASVQATAPAEAPPASSPKPIDDDDDDVEEGYEMVKVSGYCHFDNEHRAEVTRVVSAMEGLAPRERSYKIMTELGKMWYTLSHAEQADWTERAPVVKRKIKAEASTKPLTVDETKALAKGIIDLPAGKLRNDVIPILEESGAKPHVWSRPYADLIDYLGKLDPGTLHRLQTCVNSFQDQKNVIGERFYPLVHRICPEFAGKITGMLLELPIAELVYLSGSPDALQLKVEEAIAVLKQHRQRKISVAAAVAEAAAKDVPPSENPNSNERFLNAAVTLITSIAINDDDKIDLLVYAKTSVVLSVGPVEYVKKIKRWPRLRKYWPRLRRRFCSGCGKGTLDLSAPRLLVCGGCGQDRGVGRYCSEACQRADWPEHREVCPAIHTAPAHRQSTLRKTANTVLIGVLAHLGPSALRDLGTEMLEASLARTS